MTANLTVTIDERNNVLKVPNAALRFTPQDRSGQRMGGGNGNDLLSMGDGISLGNLTRRLFEASNHSVPAPLTGV